MARAQPLTNSSVLGVVLGGLVFLGTTGPVLVPVPVAPAGAADSTVFRTPHQHAGYCTEERRGWERQQPTDGGGRRGVGRPGAGPVPGGQAGRTLLE